MEKEKELSRRRVAFRVAYKSDNPAVQNCLAIARATLRHQREMILDHLYVITELAHSEEINAIIKKVRFENGVIWSVLKRVLKSPDFIAHSVLGDLPSHGEGSKRQLLNDILNNTREELRDRNSSPSIP